MAAPFDMNDDSVVVVIGTGAGGGVLSNELAQRGVSVVALEAGQTLVAQGEQGGDAFWVESGTLDVLAFLHREAPAREFERDPAVAGRRLGLLRRAGLQILQKLGKGYFSLVQYKIISLGKILPAGGKERAAGHDPESRVDDHPAVESVIYPGLPSHPDYNVARRQMTGFGGVVGGGGVVGSTGGVVGGTDGVTGGVVGGGVELRPLFSSSRTAW